MDKFVIKPYPFQRKCDFALCDNMAEYFLDIGHKGNLIFCKNCYKKLKNAFNLTKGEQNVKK